MRNIGTLFGRPIGQYWEDIEIWENVLNYFDGELKWIVELGTWQGGMSFYLRAQAEAREIFFATFDIKPPDLFVPQFFKADLTYGFPQFITPDYFVVSPGILLCDNGNKPAEVARFKELIHPRSVIAVHDWGTEFLEKDIPADWKIWRNTSTTVFLLEAGYANSLEGK